MKINEQKYILLENKMRTLVTGGAGFIGTKKLILE